jgi:hypothetical protein
MHNNAPRVHLRFKGFNGWAHIYILPIRRPHCPTHNTLSVSNAPLSTTLPSHSTHQKPLSIRPTSLTQISIFPHFSPFSRGLTATPAQDCTPSPRPQAARQLRFNFRLLRYLTNVTCRFLIPDCTLPMPQKTVTHFWRTTPCSLGFWLENTSAPVFLPYTLLQSSIPCTCLTSSQIWLVHFQRCHTDKAFVCSQYCKIPYMAHSNPRLANVCASKILSRKLRSYPVQNGFLTGESRIFWCLSKRLWEKNENFPDTHQTSHYSAIYWILLNSNYSAFSINHYYAFSILVPTRWTLWTVNEPATCPTNLTCFLSSAF